MKRNDRGNTPSIEKTGHEHSFDHSLSRNRLDGRDVQKSSTRHGCSHIHSASRRQLIQIAWNVRYHAGQFGAPTSIAHDDLNRIFVVRVPDSPQFTS
jgi:hypothetical protein